MHQTADSKNETNTVDLLIRLSDIIKFSNVWS